MPVAAKNAALYWSAYNLSRYLNQINPDRTMHLEDVTAFGVNGMERMATMPDSKLDIGGFWKSNALDDGPDNLLELAIGGTQAVVSYFPQGAGTIGNYGQVYYFENGGYKHEVPSITGVVNFTAGGQGEDSGYTGRLLHIDTTETGAVTPASGVDLGASHAVALSPRGYTQTLHVLAFDGTNATIKTQWSNDNFAAHAVDVGTFAVVTGITSEYMAAATTTIGRYMRYVLTGTFTSIQFIVLFAKR